MAVMTRAQLLKELEPGLNTLFGLQYKTYENQHAEIYDTDTSEKAWEEDVKLVGFGMAPTKQEGAEISYDAGQEGWSVRYTHEVVTMGFSITEEAIEDNLYESLSTRYTKALARAMAYTKQVKAAYILNTGFTSYTVGDGQYLFDTDHPTMSAGDQSNRPTTGTDLNETALEAAIIAIAGWRDDRGLLIAARPTKLIIPQALAFTAARLMNTVGRVGTSDNDINAIKSSGAIPGGYTVNNFLTDTNAWFLKTDIPNGFRHFVRSPLKNDMEGDFNTGNVRYKARERYSFGVSDWMAGYGSPGA